MKRIALSMGFFSLLTLANAETPVKSLSLNEAITLAVRTNPNVQSSQLSYVAQKFNTEVQAWAFQPHYAFQASFMQTRSASDNQPFDNSHEWNATPSISVLTPIGTQVSLTSENTDTDHYNPGLSLQIMQPLMRGFGRAVVESALNNAKDAEVISRLSNEGVVKTTITNVIDGYLDVVASEKNVAIDQAALKRATLAVTQTKLFIKAGHKAGNEIVTVQANAASAQSVLENDTNNLLQAKYNLLQAIGLDPNANLNFSSVDLDALINQYQNISLDETKKLVLENDIQYQIDTITLNGPTERSVLVAEDNTRWQLNLTANAATGNGGGGGDNAGVDSLFNGANQNQSVGLTLTIPIGDKLNEQAVVNAKISLKQAELALMQEKWAKETSAITAWNNVKSSARALVFAKNAEGYQEKTYQVSYQKYTYGLIDSLELQSAQNELISAQQIYLSSEINYIKSLVALDMLIGHTLATWKVTVRLS
jgi:outer membrane protein TolC